MNNQGNSFTDDELRAMITGNNPQSNAYRELLALREAQSKPMAYMVYRIAGDLLYEVKNKRQAEWDAENMNGCCVPLYAAPQLPAVPDGWVMVPITPTAAMYGAGDKQLTTKQVWDAMIAAAPKPE